MDAYINTASAGDASASVHMDTGFAVHLDGDAGADGAADIDAPVAAYAVIIRIYNALFIHDE